MGMKRMLLLLITVILAICSVSPPNAAPDRISYEMMDKSSAYNVLYGLNDGMVFIQSSFLHQERNVYVLAFKGWEKAQSIDIRFVDKKLTINYRTSDAPSAPTDCAIRFLLPQKVFPGEMLLTENGKPVPRDNIKMIFGWE